MTEEHNTAWMRINGGEPIGCTGRNPKWCMTCAHAHGEPPWADSPLKAYCVKYQREDGRIKPASVYYEGAWCGYYKKDVTMQGQ